MNIVDFLRERITSEQSWAESFKRRADGPDRTGGEILWPPSEPGYVMHRYPEAHMAVGVDRVINDCQVRLDIIDRVLDLPESVSHPILLGLASVYKDHSDFQARWVEG